MRVSSFLLLPENLQLFSIIMPTSLSSLQKNNKKKMRSFLRSHAKTLISYPLSMLLLIFSSLCIIFSFLHQTRISPPVTIHHSPPATLASSPVPPTSLRHLVFAIAGSSNSWPRRRDYVRIWWKPHQMRGYVFLDRPPNDNHTDWNTDTVPPVLISEETAKFPYSFKGGLRSAIRVARIVKEIVDRDLSDVRWFVFGDDDTVFFAENLVKTLGKYDSGLWYYVGGNSESFEQNSKYSFDMAFGGGGFAISYPLAKVLSRVLDSCLMRYPHLYGSDARIFACLAELGVGLTRESGFHQVDLRGDLSGMMLAHPLAPLISLHHLDYVEPIFPGMDRTQALEHLFESVKVNSERILQQTVCYDHSNSRTISISWGYAVQVFEGEQLLPDLLRLPRTFTPWKRGVNVNSSPFVFNVRELPRNPCQRPALFFIDSVALDKNLIWSNYSKHFVKNCSPSGSTKRLEQIKVFSQKIEFDDGKLWAPRRQCCHVLPSSLENELEIGIRPCGNEELISINV